MSQKAEKVQGGGISTENKKVHNSKCGLFKLNCSKIQENPDHQGEGGGGRVKKIMDFSPFCQAQIQLAVPIKSNLNCDLHYNHCKAT